MQLHSRSTGPQNQGVPIIKTICQHPNPSLTSSSQPLYGYVKFSYPSCSQVSHENRSTYMWLVFHCQYPKESKMSSPSLNCWRPLPNHLCPNQHSDFGSYRHRQSFFWFLGFCTFFCTTIFRSPNLLLAIA